MKMLRRTDSGALCFNSAPSIELAQLHNVVGKAPFTMGGLTVPAVRLSNDGDHCEGRFAMSKTCISCGTLKPLSEFPDRKGSKDGKRNQCNVCRSEQQAQYRQRNQVRIREYRKTYYQEHKEEAIRSAVEWNRQNPEKATEYKKKWKARNPDYQRRYHLLHIEKRRAKSNDWHYLNREHVRDLHSTWYEAHRDYAKARALEWTRKNPRQARFIRNRREARKRAAGGAFTFEQWENLKSYYDHRCLACGRQEPEIVLTVDHVIPISRGGSDDISNIQPLCGACNCRKHARIIDYRPTEVSE